jgi:hypothetical protein
VRPGGGRTSPGQQHGEWGLAVETDVMFLECPAYLDKRGAVRCGLPAEVEVRYSAESTDGPLECAKVRCPRGHGFNGTIESLTWHRRAAGPPTARSRAAGTSAASISRPVSPKADG